MGDDIGNVDRGRAESVYLHSSRWDELLDPLIVPPNLRLVPYRDELWFAETTTGKLIKVDNKHIARLGIWAFQARGTAYHEDAAKRADLSVGVRVELVPEPDNPHDRNAVTVVADAETVGYVNRQKAAKLAPILANGVELVAVVVSGAPAGVSPARVQVVAASSSILDGLLAKGR
jgi:HIRAN domain